MMRPFHLTLAGLLTFSSLPTLALSAPLSLTEQAKRAEVIVRATVGQAKPMPDGEITYLAYPLEVKETLIGDAATLPQLDGKPALYVLQGLEDAPKLSAGQDVVLLLYARKLDSPVVGVNQGYYPVVNGKVAAGEITDPAKLLDAIRSARGVK